MSWGEYRAGEEVFGGQSDGATGITESASFSAMAAFSVSERTLDITSESASFSATAAISMTERTPGNTSEGGSFASTAAFSVNERTSGIASESASFAATTSFSVTERAGGTITESADFSAAMDFAASENADSVWAVLGDTALTASSDTVAVPTVAQRLEVTAEGLYLELDADRQLRANLLALDAAAGSFDRLAFADGSFRVVDRAGDQAALDWKPKGQISPPLIDRRVFLEEITDQSRGAVADRYSIELELPFRESRDPGSGLPSQSRSSGEWLLDLDTGAIATERIRVAHQTGVSEDSERRRIRAHLTPEQAELLCAVATHPNAVRIREIPDGRNEVEDTSGGRQTISVTAPSGGDRTLPGGSYAIFDWSLTWLNEAIWIARLDLREL